MRSPDISFVIPAKDEARSLQKLYEEIVDICGSIKKSYELIFIDDGSEDSTFQTLLELRKKNKRVKIVRHRGNFGKAASLQNGFLKSKGKIIITLDADLQDNPKEIPKFLKKLDQGYDLVSGWKKYRLDPPGKVIPSKILNALIRVVVKVDIHDINCGFKAYKRHVVDNLNLYGELYRFIPITAARQKYKVGEVVVRHRARRYGKSKYGMGRNVKGLLDLITTIFLTGYIKSPGHFFGSFGLVSFFLGFLIGIYISYLRLTTGSIQYRHPLLFLGMLLMIIGIQLMTTGLLAEMLVSMNTRTEDNKRLIAEELG